MSVPASERSISRRQPPFRHGSFDSFDTMLQQKAGAGRAEGFYPRYGGIELAHAEQAAADLIGIHPDHLLLTGSGMGAFGLTIESASLQPGDTILHGRQLYGGTEKYINFLLRPRGVDPYSVDSNSIEAIERAVEKRAPKAIIIETVDNGPDMAVTDISRLINSPVIREVNPLLIIDNTLPSNAVIPLASMMEDLPSDSRIIGIESGTKSLMCNQDTAGIIYTHNEPLLDQLRIRRTITGQTLSTSGQDTLWNEIPPEPGQFREEMTTACANTFQLALASANTEGARNGLYVVSYPNLASHDDVDLANALAPEGIAPVFYISPTNSEVLAPKAIVEAFAKSGVLEQGHLSESFLFDQFGILYNDAYVRVAGGQERAEQMREVTAGFQRTLAGLAA